ncbi:hypothetical protein BU17DRAFT_75395 [Hysterangium stoloniferum]|nr:hypothetical protein BU17DRAFT_75395 [Hysterangium stoloniferum]
MQKATTTEMRQKEGERGCTIVYEGSLQGRAVAVKRLLLDFVTIATREGFLSITLELCPASISNIIKRPDAFYSITKLSYTKRGVAQITAGQEHLHILKRDLKPQTVLVPQPKNEKPCVIISDFDGRRSAMWTRRAFLPNVRRAVVAVTVGWHTHEQANLLIKLTER